MIGLSSLLFQFLVCFQLISLVTPFQQYVQSNHRAWPATTSTPETSKKARVDRNTAWNAKYQELEAWHGKYGNYRNIQQENPTLYRWMANQRKKRDGKGNHAPLTIQQIQRLEALKFPWKPRSDWDEMYEELHAFYQQHGHLRVEYRSQLYVWMETQRRKRLDTKGYAPLTKDQIDRLDQINFCWNPKQDEQDRQQAVWNEHYKELCDFYTKHGHLKVPSDSRLYTWIVYQRAKRTGDGKYAPLTEEQVRLLDTIGFPWPFQVGANLHELKWHQKYQELVEFQREHGHCNVKGPSSLYNWMIHQRQRRRSGKKDSLTDQQIQLLDSIQFPWIPSRGSSLHHQEATWRAKYQELAAFYKTTGHFKVPRPSSLYTWMYNQRSKWKKMKNGRAALTKEQIQLLDEINFPWESTLQKIDHHCSERENEEAIASTHG